MLISWRKHFFRYAGDSFLVYAVFYLMFLLSSGRPPWDSKDMMPETTAAVNG